MFYGACRPVSIRSCFIIGQVRSWIYLYRVTKEDKFLPCIESDKRK